MSSNGGGRSQVSVTITGVGGDTTIVGSEEPLDAEYTDVSE